MKHSRHYPYWAPIVGVTLLLIVLASVPFTPPAASAPTAEQAVQGAWQRAQESGAYRFATEVVQTTFPAPKLVNVGRSSRKDTLHIEGQVSLPERTLLLSLWSNGGNVLNARDGVEVRIEGDRAYGRQIGGMWQEINDFSNAFAPGSDLMAYLAGAKNVKREAKSEEGESWLAPSYTLYSFEVDGPAFARHLRDQMERQLVEKGELPAGLSLDSSSLYRGVTGQGEIWIDSDGLPLRLMVHVKYPQEQNGERVEAQVKTDFSSFDRQRLAASETWTGRVASGLSLPRSLRDWQETGWQASVILGCFGLLLVLTTQGKSKKVYAVLVVTLTLSMVVTPLLEGHQAAAFFERQAARQTELEQQQKAQAASRELQDEWMTSDWDPHRNPLAVNVERPMTNDEGRVTNDAPLSFVFRPSSSASDLSPASQSTSSPSNPSVTCTEDEEKKDADQDGLTDCQEKQWRTKPNDSDSDDDGLLDSWEVLQLGTNPLNADSDGDQISDGAEVTGFKDKNNKWWYLNPTSADSNGDGRIDPLECAARKDITLVGKVPTVITKTVAGKVVSIAQGQVCQDTDSDDTPDVFDTDDDNDGVGDRIDSSPTTVLGKAAPFTRNNPFSLVVNNLNTRPKPLPSSPTEYYPVFVDLQLRPVVTDHLTFALNVLDWPSGDEQGQIQRRQDNSSTFATYMSAEDLEKDSRPQNGDLRLVPMLEIEVSGDNIPLPLTTTLRTSVQTQGITATWPVSTQPPVLTTWISATMVMTGYQDNTKTLVHFMTQGGQTADEARIYQGTCGGGGTLEYPIIGSIINDRKSVLDRNLNTLADGKHVIVLHKAGYMPVCVPIGDIPNGPYTDKMIDQEPLKTYGVSVRDKGDANHTLLMYVPLNVMPDETGGGRAAFGAHIPYQPNGPSLGASQKMRVIWMVQMLADRCKPMPGDYASDWALKWCEYSSAWELDNTQIVHVYNEDWYLTGLSAREDHGLNVAIAWEDPSAESEQDRKFDDWLWLMARGLEDAYINGRDQDGDKIRDMGVVTYTDGVTVAETTIARRFDSPIAGGVTITDRLGIPLTATLQVQNYAYPHQDYIAQIMMSETVKVLNNNFTAYKDLGADAPTLMFIRQERYRAADLSMTDGSVAITGTTATISLQPRQVETQGSLSWAPFRYRDGKWQSYPADEYWDLMQVRFKDRFQDSTVPADYREDITQGEITIAKSFYLSIMQGRVGLLDVGNRPGYQFTPEQTDAYITNMVATAIKGAGSGLRTVVKQIGEAIVNMYEIVEMVDKMLASAAGQLYTPLTQSQKLFQAIGQGIKGYLSDKLSIFKKIHDALGTKGTIALGIAVAVAAVAVVTLTIVGFVLDSKIASFVVSTVANVLSATIMVSLAVYTIYQYATSALMELSKGAKIAGVVGLVIAIVATWGAFIATVAMGPKTLTAVLTALGKAIAATITAIIMFAINFIPVVGQVITAIILAIDSIVIALCGAFGWDKTEPGQVFCGGISGLITWAVTPYGYNIMVDFADPNRLQFGQFDYTIVYPEKGMAVGNQFHYTASLTNSINLIGIPWDWKAASYAWQYNTENLASSTFQYAWQTEAQDIHENLSRNGQNPPWQYTNGQRPLYMALAPASSGITMTEAGINRPVQLYLAEGYAVPAQECILIPNPLGLMLTGAPIPYVTMIPVCYIRDAKGTNNMDMGQQYVFDVFPATLSEFYQSVPKDGGYSLAWGQAGSVIFPRQKDFDGDGLLNKMDGGSDPDDSKWDSDGDGLSDYYEMQHRSDPNLVDTDADGLSDLEEARLGADPTRKDSDGDGLTDKEEVDGWEFVYALDADGNPLRTWITSDPLDPDTDSDGLPDFKEKAYGLNPRVVSDPTVLALESQMWETGSPRLLLRLDEAGGAAAFADASGYNHPAACAANRCPAAGMDGKVGLAARFDGNDVLTSDASISGTGAFAVAAWVKTGYAARQLIVNQVTPQSGVPYSLEVLASGRVSWWTYGWGGRQTGDAYGFQMTSTRAVADNQWHHVVGIREADGTGRIYVDGVLDSSQSAPARDLRAGSAYVGSTFVGLMDEVALFDRALTQTDVQALMAARYNPNDLIVRYNDSLNYQATVQNKLMDRYAQGLLSLNNTAPSVLNTNSVPPVPFILQPQELKVMSGTVQVTSSSASRAISLTQVAGALITDWREQSGFAEIWLPLNEPVTTTTFLDHSGNVPPRNGVCSGTTCPTRQAPGYFDYAAKFDGVNDRVVISDSTGFDFGAGAFSIALWFTKETTTRGDVWSWKNAQGDDFDIILDSDNRLKVWLQVNGSGGWVTQNGGSFSPNVWYHMAVVRDGNGNWTTYINGEAKGSGVSAANLDNINPGTPIWLGSNHDNSNNPTNPFKGSLDEVLVFKRALTPAEVRALYSKPVLRLQLDEGTRNLTPVAINMLADSSGLGNHGWCWGDTCPTVGNGVSGNGARFGGSSYLFVGPNPSLDLSGGKFALGAWVYPFPQPEPQNAACPFTAKYYANIGWVGTPVTQCEGWEGWANPADGMMVNHDWGAGSPASGIPADYFSASWEGTFWFPAGNYDFTVRSSESIPDMLLMYVDGVSIATAIYLYPVATRLNKYLGEGWHTIKVNYAHYTGSARAQFTFSPPFVQGILGSGSGTGSAYPSLQMVGRKLRIGFGDKSSGQWWSRVTTDPVLTANAWNHVIATSDGSQLNLYVNGVRVSNWGLGGATPVRANGFDVGRSSSSGSAWIDKFYVVDEADAAGKAEVSLRWNDAKICHWEGSEQKCNWGGLTDNTTVDVDVSKTVGASDTLEAWEDDDGWNDDPLCEGGSKCSDNKGFKFSTNKPGMRYLAFDWQGDRTGGLPEDSTHIKLYLGQDGAQSSDWAFYNQSMPLRGMVDEVTLYKRPLDAAEVQELYLTPFTAMHLRLDDPPGSESFENAVDLSRQGNAYCTGAACPTAGVSGRIGQAALFNGASQGLNTPLVIDQASTSQGVTMMAWVYPGGTSAGRHQIISSDNTGYDWSLLREGGNWAVFNGSGSVDTGASVDVNRWQHIAAVFRPGQGVRFYKNGNLAGNSSAIGYDTSTSPIAVGRHPDTGVGQYFDGRIDDVRIFNRALGDAEIQAMFQAAPVLLMHLDDPKDATQFTDDSGHNSGSCSAGTCPTVGEAIKGQVGTAAEFDGVDDTITVPDNTTLDLTRFSVGAWVMPTAIITSSQVLIDKGSNYSLFISPGSMTVTLSFQANCGAARNVTTTANLVQNQWNHVMGTYDGTTARLYINGYEQGRLAATGSACANTQALRIGGRPSPRATLAGRVDEVTLYDHALSEFEVRDIFLYQGKWVEERKSQTVVVDNDNPVSVLRSYTDTMPYLANQDYVMHVEAQDATSRVAMVELGVRKDGQADYAWTPAPRCMDATGGNAWCPMPNFEPTGEGRYLLQTRAIDVVGHTETPTRSYTLYVDGTAPQISATLASGAIVTATLHPTLRNAWVARLGGTVSDPQLPGGYGGSGVKSDGVQATLVNLSGIPAGQGTQRATVVGSTWTVDYVFFEPSPTGVYTLILKAADNMGNQRTVDLRVNVDATAPAASLDVARTPPAVVTSTTQLQGDATERPVPVVVTWTTDNAGGETGLTIQCNGVSRYSVGPGTFYTQTATYQWSGDSHKGAACQVSLSDTGGNGGVTGAVKVCGTQVASWGSGYGAGTTVPFTADSTSCGSALSVAGVSQVQVGFVPNMPGSPHYQESTLPGEVLHWLFEDQPDKNGVLRFQDVTGQGRTGTCTGASCPTFGEPGHLGSAAHFDGVDDSVSLASFGAFTTTTVSAWIYRTGANRARETIVSYKEHGNCGFTLSLNEDRRRQYPRLHVRVGGAWYSAEMTQSIPLNTWVHLAGTYDGQAIRLYRDGREVASASAPGGMQQCNQTTAIGSRSSQNMHFFPGLMDEVRIFDHALSATEIKALYRGAGPVLALPFDEAWAMDGTALADQSGWTYQVTLHSGAGDANNKAAPGKVGPYAFGADGTGDYISVGPNTGLDTSHGRFTQAAWVYPTPQGNDVYPILSGAAYDLLQYHYPFAQIVNRTQLNVGFGDGSSRDTFTTGSILTENAWNHIATTFNGITYTVYVNGVARASTAQFAGKLPYPTQRLDVGRGTSATGPTTCARVEQMTLAADWSLYGYRVKFNGVQVWSGVVPSNQRVNILTQPLDFCGSGPLAVDRNYLGQWISMGTHTLSTTPGAGGHTFTGSGKSATLNWTVVNAPADLRYWRGRIDDVRIYPRALAPLEVQALAQSGWQATTLSPSGGVGVPLVNWNSLAPAGVEGSYRVDVRGGDMAGHLDNSTQSQGIWRGDVDTLAPRVSLARTTVGALYHYTATAQDYNLLQQGFGSVCGAGVVTGREYFQAPWYTALSGQVTTSTQKLYRLTAACDLPNIPSLTEVGAYDTPGLAKRVVISGTYAYVADEWRGLRIVDISDPLRPRSVSVYQSPIYETPVLGIAVSGDTAYVVESLRLEVVNVSNPRNPQYLGGVDSSPGFFAGGIGLNGNYAYLANSQAGLVVYDVSAPGNPSFVSAYMAWGVQDVAIFASYAYVTVDNGQFHIVDISNPGSLQGASVYTLPAPAYGVAVSGTYAYVADDTAGLRIINLLNPASPTQVGFYNTPGSARGVAVIGNHVLVADGLRGLRLLDVSTPGSPQSMGYVDTPGFALDVTTSGNYAFVADDSRGLRVSNFVPSPAEQVTACDIAGNCARALLNSTALQSVASPASMQASDDNMGVAISNIPPVLDSTLATTIQGEAWAITSSLRALTVTVDGGLFYTNTWNSGAYTQAVWSTTNTWTPIEGAHSIGAALTAWDGNTVGDAISVIVDVQPPTLSITPTVLTTTAYHAPKTLDVTGLVTDVGGVENVQVVIEGPTGSVTNAAGIDGDAWLVPWDMDALPDGTTYTVTAEATDVAGHVTQAAEAVLMDVVPPAPVTLTLSSGGNVLAPGVTLRELSPTLTLTWTESSDGSGLAGYLAQWTAQITESVNSTVNACDPLTRTDLYTAAEGQKVWAQVASQDIYGLQSAQSIGPVYVDSPTTPDYVILNDPDGIYRGWMDSGCSLAGVDRRVSRNAMPRASLSAEQKFYVTWNTEALRLAWTGVDWDTDGDLFIYLDLQPGGAITAINPYSATAASAVFLPGVTPTSTVNAMAADYVVWVRDAETAMLLGWNGSEWEWQSALTVEEGQYHFDTSVNGGQTDLYVPFDLLGITDPTFTMLDMVAFASEEDALNLWATMPNANPVNSPRAGFAGAEGTLLLSYRYHWSGLGSGVCPNLNYRDTDLAVSISAEPAGATYNVVGGSLPLLAFGDTGQALVGDGQVITFTVRFSNRGTFTTTGALLDVSSYHALLLPLGTHLPGEMRDHQVVSLGDVGPGAEGSVTFTSIVDKLTAQQYYAACSASNPDYLCADHTRLAPLEAQLFDASHDPSGPPIDWIWISHQVDLYPPEFMGVQQPEYLVPAGSNTLLGYAYDTSAVPTVTLVITPPVGAPTSLTCPDDTSQDGQWSCGWNTTGASDGDTFNVSVQATDAFGQAGGLSKPQPLVVDTVPPAITLDLTATQLVAGSVIKASDYSLFGQISDNRGLGRVEACLNGACALADAHLVGAGMTHLYDDEPAAPLAMGSCSSPLQQTFSVADSFIIGQVSLGFNADHPDRDDIQVELHSPAGTRVRLLYNDGITGTHATDYDVLLSDAAAGAYSAGSGDDVASPYYDREARPYTPMQAFSGEGSSGTWTLTVCDLIPSANDGVYHRSRLVLKPRDTAARIGEWSYTVRNLEPLDYVEQTVYLYGIDLVGNRTSDPLSFNLTIDNVPPLIAATQVVNSTPMTATVLVLTGTVSDGGQVGGMFVNVQTPDNTYQEVAVLDGDVWQYDLRPVSPGRYRLWVNAVDLAGNVTTAGPFEVDVIPPSQILLPIVARNYAATPDLVVERIIATSSNAQVVIKNQGDRPVTDEFWVDLYVDPNPPPTGVNQTWNDGRSAQGVVWGVTAPTLSSLQPGGLLTLTVGDTYYWPSLSRITWPLPVGTLIYAQVDSANTGATYGAVLENHEITGGEYNNIASTDSISAASAALPPAGNQVSTPSRGKLPPRP